MSVIQIILLTLLGFIQPIDDYGPQLFSENKIIYGILAGLILGDVKTGLYIGAAVHLMSLGVVAIAGSSVPNYNLAAIVATIFAVTTGQDLETGITIGMAVGMMYVQLEVLHHTVSSFFARKAEECCDRKEFNKMPFWIFLSPLFLGLCTGLPIFLTCVFGVDVINSFLEVMPAWFTAGLSVAGGIMPAVGMAMLLNYMPAKQYIGCVLIGFVLSAYFGAGIIAVALIGGAWAFEKYKSLNNTVAVKQGGLEDE